MNISIRVLTILVSILSVASLVENIFQVGLNYIYFDFITYYRSITYQLFGYIEQLLSVNIPSGLKDLWCISFIGAGAYVRTEKIEECRMFRSYNTDLFPKYWKFYLFIFMGVSLTGLGILLSALQPQTYIDEMSEEPNILSRGALKNVFFIFLGTIIFFAMNGFAP